MVLTEKSITILGKKLYSQYLVFTSKGRQVRTHTYFIIILTAGILMFNVNIIYEHNGNHTTSSYFYMNINTNCLSNDIINRYNIEAKSSKH